MASGGGKTQKIKAAAEGIRKKMRTILVDKLEAEEGKKQGRREKREDERCLSPGWQEVGGMYWD